MPAEGIAAAVHAAVAMQAIGNGYRGFIDQELGRHANLLYFLGVD
jgi:hypothetical protein